MNRAWAIAFVAFAVSSVLGAKPYADGDTSGCGIEHDFWGLPHHLDIESSGQKRSYYIHLPWDYDPNHHYPVVFGFHGAGTSGHYFDVDTLLSLPLFSSSKIMIYPDGVHGTWAGPSYAHTTIKQDLQFVWDILAHLRAKYCINSARVYAAGFSNGAGFLDTLACNATVGGEFAAFAPAAGVYYTEPDGACKPARNTTPFLEFHGMKDTSAPYDGGKGHGGKLPSIEDWLDLWADRNGCGNKPTQSDFEEGKVHHLSYECKGEQGKGALQHWRVDDMGHVWPAKHPNLSGGKPAHISAGLLAMQFFDQFVRPA
ncbi:carbohydrate esterase family 1 protein [Cylindrobasidium torrendii FP15055 ss-10]|uniref:feruloyl esterase n=1 Tax=Cylindrobasidium torrendii FP15055 ss-10 TaxID=1314674 RepID=A0A0D7B9T0_9AGAR|nr:carbohydrate esterase family 1 protein [Cylindrobasidium torrendii FP15055 ss-10]